MDDLFKKYKEALDNHNDHISKHFGICYELEKSHQECNMLFFEYIKFLEKNKKCIYKSYDHFLECQKEFVKISSKFESAFSSYNKNRDKAEKYEKKYFILLDELKKNQEFINQEIKEFMNFFDKENSDG